MRDKFKCRKCEKTDWILVDDLCEFCAGVPIKVMAAEIFGVRIVSEEEYLDSLPVVARG